MRLGQGKIIKGRRSVREEGKASSLQVIPKTQRINEKTNTNNKKIIKVPRIYNLLKKTATAHQTITQRTFYLWQQQWALSLRCIWLFRPMKSSPHENLLVPWILPARNTGVRWLLFSKMTATIRRRKYNIWE